MKFRAAAITSLTIGIVLATPTVADVSTSTLFAPTVRGAQSNESVYFVMTDRFENGDSSNDFGGATDGRYASGYVPDEIGWWHGGDFKGITKRINYIKDMGFTSIWITPPVKQVIFQGSSASYHGYWGLDFLTVDPHLGTEADFKEMVKAAHTAGLKVIVDVVANHTADVIYNPNYASEYLESYAFPYKSALGKVFDAKKLAGKTTFPKLSAAKSFPYAPQVASINSKIKNPAWLNDLTNYHNRGHSDFSGESITDGDFFGLDDLFTEKPEVVKGWTDVWSYWIKNFDIDGLRIDTFKHINPEFWQAVIPKVLTVAKQQGKNDFPIYGEAADSDAYTLSSYVRTKQTPSVLDFAFQKNITNFARFGGSTQQIVTLFNADDLYTTPTTNAYQLATFISNHDSGRIGMQLRKSVAVDQPGQLLDRAKLSNALLFLLRGGPVLYYGDEVGMTGTTGDKESRQDMFPTLVTDWKKEQRIGSAAIGDKSSFDQPHELRTQITKLQQLIKENPGLRNGVQQTRHAQQGLFAVTRYAANQEYIVVYNGADEIKSVTVQTSTKNSTWRILDGECQINSELLISLSARSYCLLKADNKYSSTDTPKVQLKAISETAITGDLLQLAAHVPGDDYVEVAFSLRLPGGAWKLIGTSDHRTFADNATEGALHRVFIDPLSYKVGSKIEVIAVAIGSSGKSAQSKIVKHTIKR
jgi:glycosidase